VCAWILFPPTINGQEKKNEDKDKKTKFNKKEKRKARYKHNKFLV
jgi:hypothetical protein